MPASAAGPAAPSPDFVISRVLDAPRDLVWTVFTDADHMKHWWGPKAFTVFHATMDLRPGGTFHYGLKAPNGDPMWGKFVFQEIVPRERLVLISSFSDEAGGLARHPLHISWPLQLSSVFSFEDAPGGKTKVTMRWQAHNASAEEQKTFDDNHKSMQMGWSGTFENLEAYLPKAKA